jgi:hypothetical protein
LGNDYRSDDAVGRVVARKLRAESLDGVDILESRVGLARPSERHSGLFAGDEGCSSASPLAMANQRASNCPHRLSSGSVVWLTGNSMISQEAERWLAIEYTVYAGTTGSRRPRPISVSQEIIPAKFIASK